MITEDARRKKLVAVFALKNPRCQNFKVMSKIFRIVMVVAILGVSLSQSANNTRHSANDNDSLVSNKVTEKKVENKNNDDHAYWNAVMNAIIQVESGGNSRAVNGKHVGAMQISPILVQDCNSILKSRNINKRFTLADRYSVQKSKEMFVLIQSRYNPSKNIEKGIRIWNGGCNYRTASTNGYYRRVMSKMKSA